VLHGVDLSAAAGQLLCILGPNGSGKTTLLRCLLGQVAYKGRVELDGRDIRTVRQGALARLLAYVPQVPRTTFAFTAGQIVLMGRYVYAGPLGLVGRKDHEVARQAMVMTDTLDFADRSLEQLSGGEAQRVMIARALAQQPTVCLLDEPTSHLDIASQIRIYRMMQRLAHDWQMAVVCVSHDVNLAARFADRLLVLRDGAVLAEGTCQDVIRPELLQAAYDVRVERIEFSDGRAPLIRVIDEATES
jgi:iron complex transport system ATP-binding protein